MKIISKIGTTDRHLMSVSPAMQEYLAEAFRLAYYQEEEPYISTSDLARALGVSDPAVTRMVKRLMTAGYLEHKPYRGIRLTTDGEREALLSIRRHRLVERFLVDTMHFGWDEVHDDADTLGAQVSDELVRRMDDLIGHPRRCPHGEPIPDANGVMPRVRDYPLNEIALGAWVVSRVNTHDAGKLRYLASLHLTPGTRFTLLERAPFNGPLQLQLNEQMTIIGHELAGVLRVCSEAEFALN